MAYHCFYGYSSDIINLAAGGTPVGYYVPNGGGYDYHSTVPGMFNNFIFISGGNHALGSRLSKN